MDYNTAIKRVYDYIENDDVDKAVMACLRIARHAKDYLHAAVFLCELYPSKKERMRILYDDTNHLKPDAQKFIWDQSIEYWLDTHTLEFSFYVNQDGEDQNVLAVGVSEIDLELEQWERAINDLQIPTGMDEYDTAALANQCLNQKSEMRMRIKALHTIKQRIRTRCLNYAIRLEQQLLAQNKNEAFLANVQSGVNNYFKTHSEDVYTKLQRASQLVDSIDPEDYSLLLTQVRRAMKASADYFYAPTSGLVKCSDGQERTMGDDQFLNRFQEYLAVKFGSSSSSDLLRAEFDYLAAFFRRLNNVASKGVHAEASPTEAKQGLLGLYMFLYNVVSRIQTAMTEVSRDVPRES